jgi:FixJ family two-component response regulator
MSEPQTVFLVDDEPAVLRALSRLLRSEGYTTETFSSGREFMDKYNPGLPGCLLMDLCMPGITGLDVQQWLASSGATLPVIFLTAHDYLPEDVQTMKQGAVSVLMKPVSASALIAGIQKALTQIC